ncbi:MAG: PilZ domain-containing protein [Gammaproteobacteria bacterium]|jgi:hypothetical protein|nr:PilZ domain-containing protein [Gammaproteobacteria bacterium]
MPVDARKEPRFPVKNTVFIELASRGSGSSTSGSVARGRTLDISRGGLRVSLERELLVGAILQVGVELPARAGTLYLVGEVKWCLPAPDGDPEPGWLAGLALLNTDDSDIDNWIALISTIATAGSA